MVDRTLLHEALRHVDQAAFALARDVTEHELAVARAQLDALRGLLVQAALAEGAPLRIPSAPAQDCADEDDGPALVRRHSLDGDLLAASAARSFAGLTCESWGVPAAAASTVVDLVSELVSNAARHAGGTIDLALERRGAHVLVTVRDRSDEPPRLLPYRRGVSEQGIGLRLVDQLSESWGWTAEPTGKQVWARAGVSERLAAGRPALQPVSHRRPPPASP